MENFFWLLVNINTTLDEYSSSLIALGTIVYAIFTYKLVKETVKANEKNNKLSILEHLHKTQEDNDEHLGNIDKAFRHIFSDEIKEIEKMIKERSDPPTGEGIVKGDPPIGKPVIPDVSDDIIELVKKEKLEAAEYEARKRLPKKTEQSVRDFVFLLLSYKNSIDKTREASKYLIENDVNEINLFWQCSYRFYIANKNVDLAIKIGEEGLKKDDDVNGTKTQIMLELASYYAERKKNFVDEYRARTYSYDVYAQYKSGKEKDTKLGPALDVLGYVLIRYANSEDEVIDGMNCCHLAYQISGYKLKSYFDKADNAKEARLKFLKSIKIYNLYTYLG